MLETNSMDRLENPQDYYDKERAFILAFERMCKSGFCVDYFGGMKSNGMESKRYLSEEEKVLVNTVIQWLGTPVGQGYLQSVEEEIAEQKCNIKGKQNA